MARALDTYFVTARAQARYTLQIPAEDIREAIEQATRALSSLSVCMTFMRKSSSWKVLQIPNKVMSYTWLTFNVSLTII